MSEVKVKIKGEGKNQVMIIEVPMANPPYNSKSGKSVVLATTGGNQKTDYVYKDENVVVGLNAYIPRK